MDNEENKKIIGDDIEELSAGIEAILFWKGEPQTIDKLAKNLNKTPEEIWAGLDLLKQKIHGRGVELIFKSGIVGQKSDKDEVMLGTAGNFSPIIERLTKEELVKDLGKAGLETISIIAYKGPISRAEIDYIRGVQSNFILRNLQIRGLVEKIVNDSDHRSFLYRPTFELLQYLNVSRIEDLPEYEKVKAEFAESLSSVDSPESTAEIKTAETTDLPAELNEEDLNKLN